MKFKDQAKFDNGFAAQNGEGYGERCFTYAKDWAELMEPRLAAGEKLKDIAEECSRQADTDGLTGYMYGTAVSILAQTW